VGNDAPSFVKTYSPEYRVGEPLGLLYTSMAEADDYRADRDRSGQARIIQLWQTYLEGLHSRVAHCFRKPEVRARAYHYIAG
jgi:hypothetical protein